MSLFRGTIRPPAILSDEAVERYLEAIRAELTPDPLFRRRLRGELTNRFVATREGFEAAPRSGSMGRLGRAVLYASFTLALSATSVLAASQEAIPGDLLYPLKRQVEHLRMEVLPTHLHHDLAAYELAERIDELARLTELGDWPRVAAMAGVVAHDYEVFIAEADAAGVITDDRYVTVLSALLDRLPEPAQDAVGAIVDRAAAPVGPSSAGGNRPADAGKEGSGGASSGQPPGGPGSSSGKHDGGPSSTDAESSARPTPRPRPESSPRTQPEPGSEKDGFSASDAPEGSATEGENEDEQ